ncbi:MAG TPA: hypothetical protein ENF45_05595 [Bacteroidetes bacterium]|nr:hypothetical protein [Bacteroidota bacterium]
MASLHKKAPYNACDYRCERCLYQFDAHNFLKRYWEDEFLQERFGEQLEELSWYHTLVSVKLGRALSGLADGDEFGLEDATNSAQVALHAVVTCQEALTQILDKSPDEFDEIIPLLISAKKIEDGIQQTFQI